MNKFNKYFLILDVITWIGVVLYFVILILLGVFFLNKS